MTDTDSVTVIDQTEEHMLVQRFYRAAGNRLFTPEQQGQTMLPQMSPRKVFPQLTPTKPFSVAKLSEPTPAVDKALSILDENILLEMSDLEPFTSPPPDAPITSTHIPGDEAPLTTPTMSIEISQPSSVVMSQNTPKATPRLNQQCRLQEFDFFTPVYRKLKDSLPVMICEQTSSRGGRGSQKCLEAVHLTSPAIIVERRLKQQQKEKMADEKEKRAADHTYLFMFLSVQPLHLNTGHHAREKQCQEKLSRTTQRRRTQ